MNKVSISIALLIASLILLIIYGADVLIASVSSEEGFLPFGEQVRGIIFGAIPVIMSIAAFLIARKVTSKAVSILLIVNGGLIIVGIVVTMIQVGPSADTGGMQRTVGFTAALGLLLIALGAWKAFRDKRVHTNQTQS